MRDLAAAAPRGAALEQGRLEARAGDAHRTVPAWAAPTVPDGRGQGIGEAADVGGRGDLGRAHQEGVAEGLVVGLGVGQGEPGQVALVEQPPVDRPGVGHGDGELVEVRPGMEPADAVVGEGRLELRGAGRAGRGHVAQAVRAEGRHVDRRGEGQEGLVGADVAGGLVAADVLLARAQGHHERTLAVEVGGHAHEPAGDLADERVGRGQDAQVRAAVLRRDAQRLALPRRDVRAVRAGRGQDGQRDRLDDGHEQRAGGMGQLGDARHRLEEPEEVGVRGDDPGDRSIRVGEGRLEGGQVGRAGEPRRRCRRGISSSSSPPPK